MNLEPRMDKLHGAAVLERQFMQRQRILFILPLFATAMLLSFGRNGFLPFSSYTPLDQMINVLIVIAAPLCLLFRPVNFFRHSFLIRILPLIILWIYVAFCVSGSPKTYWPDHSAVLSIFLAILLASQVSVSQLRMLRLLTLVAGLLFSAFVLLYGRRELSSILGGTLNQRLGSEISDSLLVAYPRMLYVIAFTCFVSAIAEKRVWLKIGAIMLAILPVLVALATGGRGPLVALSCAVLFFLLGLRQRHSSILGLLLAASIFCIGYYIVSEYLPVMAQRIGEWDDAGRSILYEKAWAKISFFGRGIGDMYAHNIFLEFLQDYGIFGLVLFLITTIISVGSAARVYWHTRNVDVLWVMGLITLQLVAQMFSLNIYWAMVWGTLALPLGFAPEIVPLPKEYEESPHSWRDRKRKDHWLKYLREGYDK